jgi:histidinol dehydrogenase
MRCERFALSGGEAAGLAVEIRSLVPAAESVRDAVGEIIAAVRERGDDAIDEYARLLDTAGAEPKRLRVSDDELRAAVDRLAPRVRAGLELAAGNVRRVAQASMPESRGVQFGEHTVVLRVSPVARAAVYVPGGRAPYPSTVVMGVVPAKVAGVAEIAVCTPPGQNGDPDPVVLAACELTGADSVYRIGGAHAIAALAYGSESVAAVDVIVGPGNLYVQEAKRQVFGQVGIDGFAGPSDLVAIADATADPEPLALDLLAQAEHGQGTLVIGISDAVGLLEQLASRVARAQDTGAVACLVTAADLEQALALAEALAPEHLQLVGSRAQGLAQRVTRAGCLFVGGDSGTAFGDYVAGSNHILPTAGAARYASALSPEHFLRRFSEVSIDDGSALARAAAPVARAEGFELHARSMEQRIRDNGRR